MRKEYTYTDDRWFTIVIEGEEGGHYVQFTVYEIVSIGFDPPIPGYNRKGYTRSDDEVSDLKDAQIFISGTLKFDGIMNVSFTEFQETETMWMLSVPHDIGALDFVFQMIMDNAKQDFIGNTLW